MEKTLITTKKITTTSGRELEIFYYTTYEPTARECYGIEIAMDGEYANIPYVSISQNQALEILNILSRNTVTPYTFTEIMNEFFNCGMQVMR